jgi:hypothetical protein
MKPLAKRITFALAGVGAALVLSGAAATALRGFDGKVRLRPGQINNIVELDELELTVTDERGRSLPLPEDWVIDRVLPDAASENSRLYFSGPGSAPSGEHAVHLSSRRDSKEQLWVQLGVPSRLMADGRALFLYYGPKEVVLPFAVSKPESLLREGYEAKPVQSLRDSLDRLPASQREHAVSQLSLGRGATSLLSVHYDPGQGLKLAGAWILALSLLFGYLFRLYSGHAGGSVRTH